MGVLARFLEGDGIPTVGLSLVRLHTERLRPPRALWVPFEFGRPLGEPDDPDFQRRVLMQALGLLAAPEGPVLEDFPDDAPSASRERDETGWACPLPRHVPAGTPTRVDEFRSEFDATLGWYALALERRGRTTVGLSGLEPRALAEFICAFAGDELPGSLPGLPLPIAFKHATADLKALYGEAALAKPAKVRPNGEEISRWFWNETSAGAFLRELRERLGDGDDPGLKLVARAMLIPANRLADARP